MATGLAQLVLLLAAALQGAAADQAQPTAYEPPRAFQVPPLRRPPRSSNDAFEGIAGVAGGVEAAAASPEETSLVTINLRRAVPRGDGAGIFAGAEEGFYVGEVSVGGPVPQTLSVLFDTASGQVILPSESCGSTSCAERRRFRSRESASAVQVNTDGRPVKATDKMRDFVQIEFAQVDLGDGEVEGLLVRDKVCAGSSTSCAEVALVQATNMPLVPFRAMPHDGIVGLSLNGLSFSHEANFLTRLFGSLGEVGLAPQFSLALRGEAGTLTFGGLDPARPPAAPLRWFPVMRPEDGYWQVRIRSVRVGNVTATNCATGCRGIIDSGASRLGVPVDVAPGLQALLAGAHPSPGGGCQGPNLHLDLEGGSALTLRPVDYAGASCVGSSRLMPLASLTDEVFRDVFVLGETVLRRYDAVFDWAEQRVGFALAAPRAVRIGPPVPEAEGKTVAAAASAGKELNKFILL